MSADILTIVMFVFGVLISILSNFFWNKIKGYDDKFVRVDDDMNEFQHMFNNKINILENRTTAIESSTVTKDDLYNAINSLNETLKKDAERRDEKLYPILTNLQQQLTMIQTQNSNRSRRWDDGQDHPSS